MTLEQMNDTGFSPSALKMISEAIQIYRDHLMKQWNEYHAEKEDI